MQRVIFELKDIKSFWTKTRDVNKRLVGLPYQLVDMSQEDAFFFTDSTFFNGNNAVIIFCYNGNDNLIIIAKKIKALLYSFRLRSDFPADFDLLCQNLTVRKKAPMDCDSFSESSAFRQSIVYRLPTQITNLGSVPHNVFLFRSYAKNALHLGFEHTDNLAYKPGYHLAPVSGYEYSLGQIKLFANEFYFLEKYKLKKCIYVGCSPGDHIFHLLQCFPDLHIVGIDPIEAKINHSRFKFLKKEWKGELYDYPMISDLRSGDRDELNKKIGGWDEHVHSETMKYVVDLLPNIKEISMFKFRPSNYCDWEIELHNVLEIIGQPFAGTQSYESRLIAGPGGVTFKLTSTSYRAWMSNIQLYRQVNGEDSYFLSLLGSLIYTIDITKYPFTQTVSLFAMSNNDIPWKKYLYSINFALMIPHFMKARLYPGFLRCDRIYKYYKIQYAFLLNNKKLFAISTNDFIVKALMDNVSLFSYTPDSVENEFWVVLMDSIMFSHYGNPYIQDYFNSQTQFVKRYSFKVRRAANLEADDFHKFRSLAKTKRILDKPDHNVLYKDRILDPAGHLLNLMIASRYEVVDLLRFIYTIVGFNVGFKSEVPGLEKKISRLHTYDDYKYAVRIYLYLGSLNLIRSSFTLAKFVFLILKEVKYLLPRSKRLSKSEIDCLKFYDTSKLERVKNSLRDGVPKSDIDGFFLRG
jgi:hypothetical protein